LADKNEEQIGAFDSLDDRVLLAMEREFREQIKQLQRSLDRVIQARQKIHLQQIEETLGVIREVR